MSDIETYKKEMQVLKIIQNEYKNILVLNPASDTEEPLNKIFGKLELRVLRGAWSAPDFVGLIGEEQFLQGKYAFMDESEKNNEGIILFNNSLYFFKNGTTLNTGDPNILDMMTINAKNLHGEKLNIYAHSTGFLSTELTGFTNEDKKVVLSTAGSRIMKYYFENKYNSLIDKIITDYKK